MLSGYISGTDAKDRFSQSDCPFQDGCSFGWLTGHAVEAFLRMRPVQQPSLVTPGKVFSARYEEVMWISSALTSHRVAEIESHISANELELFAYIESRHNRRSNVTTHFLFDKLHLAEELVTC